MSCDPKRRGKRRQKRTFHGNRWTKKARNDEEATLCADSDSDGDEASLIRQDEPCTNSSPSATPTRSEVKLQNLYAVMKDSSDESSDETELSDSESEDNDETVIIEQELDGYRLIDIAILNQNVSSQLACTFCHGSVQLLEVKRKGLGSELAFHCENPACNRQRSFPSCPQITAGNLSVHSVNRRATFAMRCIGGDLAELETFCGVMGLPPPVRKSSHNKINKTLEQAACTVQKKSMQAAAKLEHSLAVVEEDQVLCDIDVSFDGTYMTRGHTSKVGVATLIGCETGKVLDTGSRSKVCKSCDYWSKQDQNTQKYRAWQATHGDECTQNHDGSSGAMEADIAKEVFSRSVELYNLRYTKFIGDGDTNSFKKVFDAKVYGDQHPVEKIECVGHVQKRMGTRLRNLRARYGKRQLADGKTISGRGRLTEEQVKSIQQHYGNAIRNNKGNLTKMREAVWAIYFHKGSTDEEPVHNFCLSWCPYKKAEAAGTLDTYKHTNNLPKAVMDEIKPIFKDLVKTELLKKCLDGYTQNANESVNSVIWKFCPKVKHHGLTVVNTATAVAVCIFNDGTTSLGEILKELQIEVGVFSRNFFEQKDAARIITAQRQSLHASKEYRRRRRMRRLGREEEDAEREGFPYLAGGH